MDSGKPDPDSFRSGQRSDGNLDKAKYDTASITSDYIVIDTGIENSKSDIELRTYSYLSNRMLDEIDSSDPEETSLNHQFENGDVHTDVKPALSVEDELSQRKETSDVTPPAVTWSHETDNASDTDDSCYTDTLSEVEEETMVPRQMSSTTDDKSFLVDAVKNDAGYMINDLLEKSPVLTIYSALLVSIKLGRDHITKMIVQHQQYDTLKEVTRMAKIGTLHTHKAEKKGKGDVAQYDEGSVEGEEHKEESEEVPTEDNTPIMLASLRNQFDIVEALMSKGETIDEPHVLGCKCEECQEQTDEIRAAKTRLNTYRALACDAYVVLASQDPIHRAFELGQKFQKLANEEKHYKAEYLDLAEQCGDLSSRILDKVQDGEELDVLLNEIYGYGDGSLDQLARLKLAIRYNEKKFVAHPACQKILTTIWMGTLNPSWVDGVGKALMFFLVLTVAYPFLAIGYCLHPMNKTAPFLRTPLVKFCASTSAFLIFVAILMVSSFTEVSSAGFQLSQHPHMGPLYKEYLSYTGTHVHIQDVYVRVHTLGTLTVMLCIWLVGMIWENVKKVIHEGTNYFTDNMFNIINFSSVLCYVVSFGFRFYALHKVDSAVQYFSKSSSWVALSVNESSAIDNVYWIDADRNNWHPYEADIISEAIFSVASILSITKITYVFTISERIGPLLLSLAKMLEDVFAFMVLFVFIIVAFVVGFHNLYWYYYNSVETSTVQGSKFTSIASVVEFFFWSIFGLVELDEGKFDTSTNSQLTSIVAYVLFAIYNWMMVIILINMLIAMMSRSYEVIAELEDTEWKFARTKLFLEYMRDDSTVASPYNLLPTWKGVYLLYKSFSDHWCYTLAGRIPRKPRDISIKKFATKKITDKKIQKGHQNKEAKDIPGEPAITKDPDIPGEPAITNDPDITAKPDILNKPDMSDQISASDGSEDSNINKIRRNARRHEGPSDRYIDVMRGVVKRFCQKGGSGENAEDAIEQVQLDVSSLRKEMMSNIFRQDQERAVMAATINKIDKDLYNARKALTEQHTHMKFEHENRVVEMKGNMHELDEHIAKIFERLSKCVETLEERVTAQIVQTTSKVQLQITDVHQGMKEINVGIEKQADDVSKIQGTLLRQVDDVSSMHGTLATLYTDVSNVQSTLSNSVVVSKDQQLNPAGSFEDLPLELAQEK